VVDVVHVLDIDQVVVPVPENIPAASGLLVLLVLGDDVEAEVVAAGNDGQAVLVLAVLVDGSVRILDDEEKYWSVLSS
jgi:hypothetical protein